MSDNNRKIDFAASASPLPRPVITDREIVRLPVFCCRQFLRLSDLLIIALIVLAIFIIVTFLVAVVVVVYC